MPRFVKAGHKLNYFKKYKKLWDCGFNDVELLFELFDFCNLHTAKFLKYTLCQIYYY